MARCFGDQSPLYAKYHDTEWGIPSRDDTYLFELLILEGAQAGLSWETILKRREGYRAAFHGFDPEACAQLSDATLEELLSSDSIIRHRKKIYSVRENAAVFLFLQKEYGSFAKYLWSFVNNTPLKNRWRSWEEVPTKTAISTKLSKDLKKRGMSFVGPTIMYAYMQAVGMVNDHIITCPKYTPSP